ncbi:MAG: class I SAM-dependent methyltransferase, partial [Candidatus Magasanikbacteria bacterium]|nr:class I SAM-dependent methyltransferase [Candidatus Magasanikbacteria bacterium]
RAYAAAKRSIRPVPLLDGAQEANARHEAVVNQYATLPQWFSFWEYRGQWQPRWWWSGWWRKFNNRQLVRRLRHWLRPLRRSAEQIKPPPTLPELKAKWEALARENAFYYAHPDTPGGEKVDEFELRESGRADVAAHLTGDPRWGERAAALSGGVALEIGAGVGRLTEHLAPLFKQLHAVDISPEMLAVARRRLGAQSTVQWAETSGGELPFADATFDFIFSAETFKHFPARELIARYLSEIYRVLKSGGTAKLELRTGAEVYRSRWFHGVALSPAEARALAEQAGLRVLDIKIATPKSMWLWVEKQRIS